MGYQQFQPPGRPPVSPGVVKAPAIALMAVAGINILSMLVGLVFHLIGAAIPTTGMPNSSPQMDRAMSLLSGGLGLAIYGLAILVSAFVGFGAMRMMQFRSWGLSLAAAIVAITCIFPWPCFCCVPLGVPFGIWALIVLLMSGVKESFTA